MIELLLAAQISIVSTAPPLPAAEAVRVLRASRSTADRTDVRSFEIPELRPVVVLPKPADEAPRHVARPLNCCGRYEIPLPYPTIRIITDGARRKQ